MSPPDFSRMALPEFRSFIREWLAAHCPESIRRPFDRLQGEEALSWQRIRFRGGIVAPGWPVEHGGMGLSVDRQIAMTEEFERYRVARTVDAGISMLGPTLIKFGTEAQKAYYLPRILSGEHRWCQGYSEPGAGSDLASLSTSAVRDGDDYVIDGQKTWTSYAHDATHCFMLVRTSVEDRPQKGITFVLADMRNGGVTVRPITNIAGHREFCEVFLDGLRTPINNRVGEEGHGWTIAKSLLGFERIAIGTPALSRLALETYRRLASELGEANNPVVRHERERLELRYAELDCLFREIVDAATRGIYDDVELSILKLTSSELFQAIAQATQALAAEAGAIGVWGEGSSALDLRQLYMISRPASIFGGTSEIQRNILSKRWLNLPER